MVNACPLFVVGEVACVLVCLKDEGVAIMRPWLASTLQCMPRLGVSVPSLNASNELVVPFWKPPVACVVQGMGNLVNGCVILICMAMFNMTGEKDGWSCGVLPVWVTGLCRLQGYTGQQYICAGLLLLAAARWGTV